MAIPSGLASRLVVLAESVYKTPVTVSRGFEFYTEGVKREPNQVDVGGLRNKLVIGSTRTETVVRGAAGPITMPITAKGMPFWWKQILGASAVSGAGAAKTHLATLDASGGLGVSFTAQIQRPEFDGTVISHTYAGGKVKTAEINHAMNQEARLTVDCDFASEAFPSLVSPTYLADNGFFSHLRCAVTFGGTALFTKNVKIAIDKKLGAGEWGMGNSKLEPVPEEWLAITGELQTNYDKDYYDKYLAGTQDALVFTWTAADDIPSSSPLEPFKLVATVPKAKFLNFDPNIGGPSRVNVTAPWACFDDYTNQPISISQITTDTAA